MYMPVLWICCYKPVFLQWSIMKKNISLFFICPSAWQKFIDGDDNLVGLNVLSLSLIKKKYLIRKERVNVAYYNLTGSWGSIPRAILIYKIAGTEQSTFAWNEFIVVRQQPRLFFTVKQRLAVEISKHSNASLTLTWSMHFPFSKTSFERPRS